MSEIRRPKAAESEDTAAETLPEELVWAEGGHASDVALSTLADGQGALLPEGVARHVQACARCTQHLGHAALLSLHVARELGTLAEHERALVTARRPLPRMAITLGLAVAVLALVPSAADLGSFASTWSRASMVARVVRTVAHAVLTPGSPLGVLVTCGTAAALVVSSLVVVKLLPRLPRKEVSS